MWLAQIKLDGLQIILSRLENRQTLGIFANVRNAKVFPRLMGGFIMTGLARDITAKIAMIFTLLSNVNFVGKCLVRRGNLLVELR